MRKCDDTLLCVNRWLRASLTRSVNSQPKGSARLDPTRVKRQDCRHSQLTDLSQQVKILAALKFQANPIRQVALTSVARNYSHAPFPTLATITATQVALYDIEEWIFAAFRSKSFAHFTVTQLFDLFERYLLRGKAMYDSQGCEPKPLGYSRMILACFTFVCSFDYIACERHPMLRQHHTGMYSGELFQSLVLPEREATTFAFEINAYINGRNKAALVPTSIVDTQVNGTCAAARMGAQSNACKQVRQRIETEANKKAAQKRAEVEKQRAVYRKMIDESDARECDFDTLFYRYTHTPYTQHSWRCQKCQLKRDAENMRVSVYEWPLPADHNLCNAVVFELLMPLELCTLRDALCVLRTQLLAQRIDLARGIGTWLAYREVNEHATNRPKYVTLGSDTKLFAQTHYSCKHPKEPTDVFLPPNGYTVRCTDTSARLIQWQNNGRPASSGLFEPKVLCTFRLAVSTPYAPLQWSLANTLHTENRVIARLDQCGTDLRVQEYKRFACVRAGHRLQLMNVLDAFESGGLSFDTSSVVLLVAQSVWQIGPLNGTGDICTPDGSTVIYSASQAHFANANYLRKLHATLRAFTASIQKKWSGQNVLLVVILLTQRAISMIIMNPKRGNDITILDQFLDLLLECRRISVDWQYSLRQVIAQTDKASTQRQQQELYEKLKCVCSFTALTYEVDEGVDAQRVWRNDEDIVTWLSAMSELHKLRSEWPATTSGDKYFLEFVLSRVDMCSIRLERQFVDVVNNGVLTRFVQLIWSDAFHGRLDAWTRVEKPSSPVWYTCSFHKDNDHNASTVGYST